MPKHHAVKAYRETEVNFTFITQRYMGVSFQLHAPASLYLENEFFIRFGRRLVVTGVVLVKKIILVYLFN
jgi:hypothetical protein